MSHDKEQLVSRTFHGGAAAMKPIIAKEFKNDVDMLDWMASEEELRELARRYPPALYQTKVDIWLRVVVIEKRKDVQ